MGTIAVDEFDEFVDAHRADAQTLVRVRDVLDEVVLLVVDEVGHEQARHDVAEGEGPEGRLAHDAGDEAVDDVVIADYAAAEAVEAEANALFADFGGAGN